MGNFWNLVEQAGPLRWPIFAVLGIGLTLVIGKLYELLRDRSLSRALFEIKLQSVSLPEIRQRVSAQRESMLASLQSAMLNVFQSGHSEGMLHDEIANFVSFQQDQFGVFRRRMEFLADTAGALGLMGTVWGMFVVFFQGTSDKDVILRGMGIALITTLLGLVVSIILNLSATELSTFFGKRLEQVSKKSDELRFRLLDLAAEMKAVQRNEASVVERTEPAHDISEEPTASAAPALEGGVEPAHESWWYLEPDPAEWVAGVGDTVRDLRLRLRRNGGDPVSGAPVVISVPHGAGTLDDGGSEIRRQCNGRGEVSLTWHAPERAGVFTADLSIPGQAGTGRRVELRVEPGAPHLVKRNGNNQAAVAGMRLQDPLALAVYDRFDNPIPGVPVTFRVIAGNGRLGQHGTRVVIPTGGDGVAKTAFAVSSEPGANEVVAEIDGHDQVEFVAFGTEV